MRKKQFKAESKKLLDMMINSIYTNREIFMRELISNASDAIDKLYFKSLTDSSVGLAKDDFEIFLSVDKDARTITVSDNGIGMTQSELEDNLGTIAKSGSLDFKEDNENADENDIEVIGQFGVGFYSSFMVAKKVEVVSKAYGEDTAHKWTSEGADGYTIEECEKENAGTDIILYLKDDSENESYSTYLESYTLSELVKKYSDYIRYPIKTEMTHSVPDEEKEGEYKEETAVETLNSMVPLWRKNKSEIKSEEYDEYYKNKFYDYESPLSVIHFKTEGQVTFDALIYIPAKAPYDYYSKEYEKGLQLYTNGVLITEKCSALVADCFSFVKGIVDSADLNLNISRETLQDDYRLKIIAKAIDKKIKNELKKMLTSDREKYEKFFSTFGVQLKWGIYANYGAEKEQLQDFIMFKSAALDKYVTLKEYIEAMPDGQKDIYYAGGESPEKIKLLPQTEAVRAKGYDVLCFTDDVDEFAIQMLMEYDGKKFANICKDELDIASEDEKKELSDKNESAKEMLDEMKSYLGDEVSAVKFSNSVAGHAVGLSAGGYMSLEMAKVLNQMPGSEGKMKAELVLEINAQHPIAEKLFGLFAADKEKLKNYTKLLYNEARLISGLQLDNPTEFADMITALM
ncbi:MAG: molecular chaperone HtpG [Clostridiales bacterium]|nr:molecular chaperone HtpG [Clostridiales bacterium]